MPEVIPTDRSVDSLIDVDTGVTVVPSDFQEQSIKTETQAARIDLEEEAKERERVEAAEKKAHEKKESAKAKAKKEARTARKELEDPVVAVNSALAVVTLGILGVGGYKKYQAGALTWKLAGLWTVGLSAFIGADYFASRWFYEKYPPKK